MRCQQRKSMDYIRERLGNMEELNEAFGEYMEAYKALDIPSKRKEIINATKELIVVFEQLATKDNIELQYLRSREINDLKEENTTEDDFLEAELVYLEVAKNMIGQYLDKKL